MVVAVETGSEWYLVLASSENHAHDCWKLSLVDGGGCWWRGALRLWHIELGMLLGRGWMEAEMRRRRAAFWRESRRNNILATNVCQDDMIPTYKCSDRIYRSFISSTKHTSQKSQAKDDDCLQIRPSARLRFQLAPVQPSQ